MNIILLGASLVFFLRRKNILNLLISCSLTSIIILEAAKITLLSGFVFAERIAGLGFCMLSLFWLILSISFLPPKSYFLNRLVISPVLGFLSLLFFLIWWIYPFLVIGIEVPLPLAPIAKYFFMLLILNLSFCLSNFERSIYLLKQMRLRLLLSAAIFFFLPYILLATFAVLFSVIHKDIFITSSLSVLVGAGCIIVSSRRGVVVEKVKEDTAVHTSITLLLIGGYLFFIGTFIKLFHIFGWNLQSLFSFLTTLFIFFAFAFIAASSSFRERIKNFLFRHLTRQKYDWQKIWEQFTHRISLMTGLDQIRKSIEDAVAKIMKAQEVEVFLFDEKIPFEERFCDWLLRKAGPFYVKELSEASLAQRYPAASSFFRERRIDVASPLYGEKKVIGLIALRFANGAIDVFDKELLKVLSLQASSAILTSWAYRALEEAEKKESIYKVSTFIIHDLKNFTNSLSLLIANKDKFNRPQFQHDALFTLESTLEKMKRLIEEFRALRGDIVLECKHCNLQDIAREALRDIGRERLKDVECRVRIDAELEVWADAQYLYKVIFNLVSNALEAMENKGTLIVKSVRDGKLGCMQLAITDTGPGMSEEFIQEKLFKPFSSTKKKGLGIGLYQCKTIIQAHGGEIEVRSKEGRGSTFTITLPGARQHVALSR